MGKDWGHRFILHHGVGLRPVRVGDGRREGPRHAYAHPAQRRARDRRGRHLRRGHRFEQIPHADGLTIVRNAGCDWPALPICHSGEPACAGSNLV